MKTSRSTESTTQHKKGRVRVGSDGKAKCDRRCKHSSSEIDGGEVRHNKVGKKDQKRSKSQKLFKSKKMVGSLDFFIPGTRPTFTKLRQVFIKALIFYYFDSECHIRIKINILGYAIDRILSQLILDDLD